MCLFCFIVNNYRLNDQFQNSQQIFTDEYYNFIMKNKGTSTQNPQREPSFAKENRNINRQQQRLDMQIIRVHAIHKQRSIEEVWTMDQDQLCEFFTYYELFPQALMVLNELLNSKTLKLIRSNGKIYFGQIDRKKRNGKGVNVSKEGNIYEGQYYNNDKNGRGVEIYLNGNVFIGHFLNDKKHGEGKFYWFNLSSNNPKHDQFIEYYDGEWWGGLPDGQGIHQKLNGDLYIGQFKNGLKHGEGKEWYGNGDYYKGQCANGLPEGYGEYIWQDRSSFKGDFKQGLRSGYGVWEANNDRLESYKGHYAMDKKSGYGVYMWDNGWCYKGHFDNDLRNGYGELYDRHQHLNYQGFWEKGQQIEKEVIISSREKDLNFRTLQTSRYNSQGKKTFTKETGEMTSKKSGSKLWENRQDVPDLTTIWHTKDYNVKKRPLSNNSYKVKGKRGLNKSGRFYESQHTTKSSRPCIGAIESNLFVPCRRFDD